jgi:hypothetical protein
MKIENLEQCPLETMNTLKNLLGVPSSPPRTPPPSSTTVSTPNSTTALLSTPSQFALNRAGSTHAARAPRRGAATTCPLCFAVVPSEAALRHLDECDALTTTPESHTPAPLSDEIEFGSFEAMFVQLEAAERRLQPTDAPDDAGVSAPPAAPLSLERRLEAVAHQQAYWEKLERLQANGYLSHWSRGPCRPVFPCQLHSL